MTVSFDRARYLKGYIPDLPTPFDADGDLDLVALERLCHRHLADGGGALAVCTVRGEAPTLTQEERIAVILCAVRSVNNHVPVIAGTSSNDTARAIIFARDAAEAGASVILSSVPYYNKPTQAGLAAHFAAIAEASPLPVILHDELGRCVRALADETVARLADLPQIVGLCDASGDLTRVSRLRAIVGRDFRLLSSDDVSAPDFLVKGGDGCISGACVVAPLLCRQVYDQVAHGDMARARLFSRDLATLSAALAHESEPAPLKHALDVMGVLRETMRLPMVPASRPTQIIVAKALAGLQRWVDLGWIESDDNLRVGTG